MSCAGRCGGEHIDDGQTAAFREFEICFVSVVCALNGRKVMTWIMKKAKRTMI